MVGWKGLRPGFPSGLQVLVVDGAELEDQLKQLGYAATLFATAREAAVFLSQGQGLPDIILAEARSVHVGDGDSQWLLAQARARALPLVLMSDSGSTGEVMKGIELGAVDYLEKPVSPLKLRNIWQHVVRKLMAGTADDKQPAFSAKPEPQPAPAATAVAPAAGAGSGPAAPATPSPTASMDQGMHSGVASHSSKCSEAEASSCSENTKAGPRVRRSADTSAESSGKAADGAAAPAAKPLSRASSSTLSSRSRSRRAARSEANRPPLAAKPAAAAAQPASVSAAAPAAAYPQPVAALPEAWQPAAGCMWGGPTLVPTPMGWQQVGMPASFMPVDHSPPSVPTSSATPDSAKSPPPASLPSMTSFASALSCTTELDLPFSSAADLSAAAVAASPSFGASDDSLHSDFTDLMLPNDLDLDLMFGDGVDALLGVDSALCSGPPPSADKPPIGLALRKSQSLVDLINASLASGVGHPATVPGDAAASGVAMQQCA